MKEEILKLRSEGLSYSQIQNILKCSQSTISYHCNPNGKKKAQDRSKKQIREYCECGKYKAKGKNKCTRCEKGILPRGLKIKRNKILDSTKGDYLKNYTSNTRHTSIRRLARVIMNETGKEKKCLICGFDNYVEICHIKAIKDFDNSATIREINSIDNLVYLCPNHHKLLDLGKISL